MNVKELENVGLCHCRSPLKLKAVRKSTAPIGMPVTTIVISCTGCGLLYNPDHERFAHECDHVRHDLSLSDPVY